jgi:hypothetical protein
MKARASTTAMKILRNVTMTQLAILGLHNKILGLHNKILGLHNN